MTKADKEGQRKAPILRFKGFTDDWEQRKLGEMITERKILRFDSREFPLSSFIKNEGVVPKSSRYDRSFLVKSNSKKYKETRLGDFIYSSNNLDTGSIGLNNYGNAVISPVYSVFTSKDTENLETSFINLLFKKNFYKNKMLRFRQGVTYGQWKIKENDFLNLKVYTSNSIEIEKIIAIFSKISQCIALYERKLKLLSQVKKYFLDNLFAEKEYPNLRFRGFTDAWEQRQLGKLVELITKGTTPRKYDGNINFIKVENIKEMSINPKVKISESEHLGKLKRSVLKENDILFSIAGSLGKVGLVDSTILPANTNQALAIIRLTENKDIEYSYIFSYLKSNYIQHFIRRLPSVGAQPNLSLKQINELVIKFPNYCEQQKISNMLDKLNNILTLYENKQQHLTEIKNTLLNTMFI